MHGSWKWKTTSTVNEARLKGTGNVESIAILGASSPLTPPFLEDKQQQLISTTCSPAVCENKLRKPNVKMRNFYYELVTLSTNGITQRWGGDKCF